MLKGCDDPFFSLNSTQFIKLKKDYIIGLRDIADLAIIDERHNIMNKQELNINRL
jgi:hypothetical protein